MVLGCSPGPDQRRVSGSRRSAPLPARVRQRNRQGPLEASNGDLYGRTHPPPPLTDRLLGCAPEPGRGTRPVHRQHVPQPTQLRGSGHGRVVPLRLPRGGCGCASLQGTTPSMARAPAVPGVGAGIGRSSVPCTDRTALPYPPPCVASNCWPCTVPCHSLSCCNGAFSGRPLLY